MSTQTQTIQVNRGIDSRVKNVALWALQLGLAFMFVKAALPKLAGDPQMIGLFEVIGMGQWFRYVTGGLEILGAGLLLVPALAGIGGLLLAGVMVGAVATHVLLIGGSATMAILFLVGSAIVAFGRRDSIAALVRRFVK